MVAVRWWWMVCARRRAAYERDQSLKWRRDALAGDYVAVVLELKWCTHKKLLHFRILGGGSHGATLAYNGGATHDHFGVTIRQWWPARIHVPPYGARLGGATERPEHRVISRWPSIPFGAERQKLL